MSDTTFRRGPYQKTGTAKAATAKLGYGPNSGHGAVRLNADKAREIAVEALTFLAQDMERLSPFLNISGLDPATLRERAGEDTVLAAVLDYLGQDESLLLTFASNAGLKPELVAAAPYVLQGKPPQG